MSFNNAFHPHADTARAHGRLITLAILGTLMLLASPLAKAGEAAEAGHLLNTWHAVETGYVDAGELRPKEKNWETYTFADDGTFSLTAGYFGPEMETKQGEWTYDPATSVLELTLEVAPGMVRTGTMEVRELTASRLLLVGTDTRRPIATLYSLTPSPNQPAN